MTIENLKQDSHLTLKVAGRVDTITAPDFEKEIRENIDGITKLSIDIADVAYISSAGLRVLLSAQKIMNKQGEMEILNVQDAIKEIFDVTGFSDILTIR